MYELVKNIAAGKSNCIHCKIYLNTVADRSLSKPRGDSNTYQ